MTGLADAVEANLRGRDDAQLLLQRLAAGGTMGAELYLQLKRIASTSDDDRLRGFSRELQKTLERAGVID